MTAIEIKNTRPSSVNVGLESAFSLTSIGYYNFRYELFDIILPTTYRQM